MAKRLFLVALIAAAFACKSKGGKSDKESRMGTGSTPAAAARGRDAVESALYSLGIDGRVLKIDLNDAEWQAGDVRIAQAHLLSEMLLLETWTGKKGRIKPHIFAINRNGLQPRWVSEINESTLFPASETPDVALLTSQHFVHALEKDTGRRAVQFTGGSLQGLRQPALRLPFTPTGAAVGQSDTMFLPSLGTAETNKNVETFSLINGQRGWGYRASGMVLTSPVVGGDVGDPKLYFVTKSGLLTCLDANNYGRPPAGARWEELLEAGVEYGFFLTPDTKVSAGAVYVADREGMVYCLDRITGARRWVSATGEIPAGHPQVFGNLCVLKTDKGLLAFDKDNVLYRIEVKSGPDAGNSILVSSSSAVIVGSGPKATLKMGDGSVAASHLAMEIQGEVLAMRCTEGNTVKIDGGAAVNGGMLRNGSEIAIGRSVLQVKDTGSDPLWRGLDYDRIICRIGNKLIAAVGTQMIAIDAYTGAPVSGWVQMPDARLVPTNTTDANLFVVSGEAVVHALFPR